MVSLKLLKEAFEAGYEAGKRTNVTKEMFSYIVKKYRPEIIIVDISKEYVSLQFKDGGKIYNYPKTDYLNLLNRLNIYPTFEDYEEAQNATEHKIKSTKTGKINPLRKDMIVYDELTMPYVSLEGCLNINHTPVRGKKVLMFSAAVTSKMYCHNELFACTDKNKLIDFLCSTYFVDRSSIIEKD